MEAHFDTNTNVIKMDIVDRREVSTGGFIEEIFGNIVKSDDNNNFNNFDNKKSPKRKKSNKTNGFKHKANKKHKTTKKKTLDDLIFNENSDSENLDPGDSDEDEEKKCTNPLCDHKTIQKGDRLEIIEQIEVNSISDLIKLGKSYHCKQNKVFHGINMRILCSLVEPLTELEKLVGMREVKKNIVNQIVFFLQGFNTFDKCNNCVDCSFNLPCPKSGKQDMLHTVITGPPGVGKTRLGRILGKIYKSMGVLSGGDMKVVSRSDLIGKYLGHTAAKTQGVIDDCEGGVMFIDEAYSLGNKEGRDSFSKECLDTLNQNLTEKEDFLCIIAGYKDALEDCFFNYNEGLRRRFTFRYDIPGYDAKELQDIFATMVKQNNWKLWYETNENDSPEVIVHKQKEYEWANKYFKDNMEYFPHYGGDMETLFLNCKIYHGRRVLFLDQNKKKVISRIDIENGFNEYISHRKYDEEKSSHFYL